MSEESLRVYIVDDDPSARLMAGFQFAETADITTEFENGDSFLAAIDPPPDMIILDVDMPGSDGIAVCHSLRDAGHTEAHVLFVSAHDDLDTRLRAYDAGGDDYIVKPYSPEELSRKIDRARREIEKRRNAAGQARNAQEAAFAAMSTMSEMGITLDFLRRSFACQTPEELAATACDAMLRYGCAALVHLGDGDEAHCFGPHGECTDLEHSLLKHARGMDRIFQFGNRMTINYPHATFLIPNIPVDDPALVGRLRDHLAVLAEGTEARYLSMRSERHRMRQAEAVIAAVGDLTRTLEDIDRRQESQRVQLMAIAHQQLVALTNSFVHLGLSERQEESLVELTQSGIDEITSLQDYGLAMSSNLRGVIAQLRTVAGGSEAVSHPQPSSSCAPASLATGPAGASDSGLTLFH